MLTLHWLQCVLDNDLMKLAAVLLPLFLLFLIACSGAGPVPRNLETKPVGNILGLDLNEMEFSWDLHQSAGRQMAYQILVASDETKLAADFGDLWDSGFRYTQKRSGILYRGKAMEPGAQVWWKVRIWDESSQVSEFSAPAGFQTSESSQERKRIVLLGGTLISEMERYAWLETAITARWPHHDITFRNLGWPADDMFGNARSGVGSAENTRSWEPPDPEEGYGFTVLKRQVGKASPTTLIVGYGSEAAYADDEEAYRRFAAGYARLLIELESYGTKLILLSPHRHWRAKNSIPDPSEHNRRLKRASNLIDSLARARGHVFIDLFEKLNPLETGMEFSDNGIRLTQYGVQRMAQVILDELGLTNPEYGVSFSSDGKVLESTGAEMDRVVKTNNAVRFDITADQLNAPGVISVPGAHLLKIDGKTVHKGNSSPLASYIPDSLQLEKLRQAIIKKNLLHRFKINPLNSAYIYLFRQHEMGHLSSEMQDFDRLIKGQEELIALLRLPQTHRYEVEVLVPWKSPQKYSDYRVPKNIPKPDIAEELKAFTVAEGFQINLYAADPMIANPINLSWDAKGRAWVSMSSTYPQIKPGQQPNDRIVILEDTDHDRQADKYTVFAENLLMPHSVMPVKGGAYVCSSTELLFLADADGDDRAESRRAVFSGFGNADMHHTIHGLRWAPWGDLHFTQSLYIHSYIQTPHGRRQLNGSGIWKFRPESERIEVFSRGLVNPWGLAFDQWGQAFATDGAGGAGVNYLFPGSAHRTAVGVGRVIDGLLEGKPKNTGAEIIYSCHMPKRWQGSLLANDYRRNRTVRYQLTESGSGYKAEEVETVIRSSHRSYRPIDIKTGPDGAIYIVDWYNPIIAHGEVDFYHPSRDRAHGRIWRLTAVNRPLVRRPQIGNSSIEGLLDLLKAPEQFTRMQANRELVKRDCTPERLRKWVNRLSPADPNYNHHRLEALWLGAALNAPDTRLLEELLGSPDHHARAAAVRMVAHWRGRIPPNNYLGKMVRDRHPQVRLEAVNALREEGSPESVNLAMRALDYPLDDNLDYTIWLTARTLKDQWLPQALAGKPVFDGKLERLTFALKAAYNQEAMKVMVKLVKEGKLTGQDKREALFMIADLGGAEELALALQAAEKDADLDLLRALANAPAANVAVPENGEILANLLRHPEESIRTVAAQLAGRWKIKVVRSLLRDQAGKSSAGTAERLEAARALFEIGDSASLEELAKANPSLAVRATAAAAWAGANPEEAATNAVNVLTNLESAEDAVVILQAYIRREEGPDILAEALSGKQAPRAIAVEGIRLAQSSGRDMSSLISALTEAGSLQAVGQTLDGDQRELLLSEVETSGDWRQGRQIYFREELQCSTCHLIDGIGGSLGPDLNSIGGFMTPPAILESLLDPSAYIKEGYETVILTSKDGTIVSGTLRRKTDTEVLLNDIAGNLISVSNENIDKLDNSQVSLMPAGLTSTLRHDELVDLMRFLTSLGKGDGRIF